MAGLVAAVIEDHNESALEDLMSKVGAKALEEGLKAAGQTILL